VPQPEAVLNHRYRVRASDTPANENRPKFRRQLDLGRGCWPEIGRFEIQFWCGLADAGIKRWHVHDRPPLCTAGSALVVMATAAAGQNSAILIFLMVNYKVMLHD